MRKKFFPVIVLCICAVLFFVYRFYKQVGIDNTPPVITIDDEEGVIHTVSMNDLDAGLLQGVTAYDHHDGNVTASILVEQVGHITNEHQVQVGYAAFDAAGNVAKAQRTVQLTDYIPPRFTLNAPLAFVYGTNFDPLKQIGAEDLTDGNIRHRVKATLMDESAISAEGTHNVLFRVTNSLGDTAQLILPVEVYFSGRYDAQLFLTDYLIYLPLHEAFDPEDYLFEYIAAGQTTDLTDGLPRDMELTVSGKADLSQPGVYTIGYTITYTRGSHVHTGYSKLIVVVEG